MIEGTKDCRALNALGIDGDMFLIQSSGGPVAAADYVLSHGGRSVILTDWDRRGGTLCRDLINLLPESSTDTTVRADLSRFSAVYIKDVESLDTLVARLRGMDTLQRTQSFIR